MPSTKIMPTFKTIDKYIDSKSDEAKVILNKLRSLITEAVPEIIELHNSKVPSFTLVEGVRPNQQIMIVAYKKYVSFYPYQKVVEYFEEELKGYELGKGTVKFKYGQLLPADLIIRMVQYRKKELLHNV